MHGTNDPRCLLRWLLIPAVALLAAPAAVRASLPTLPPNPAIVTMMAEVSEDSLRATLQSMQGCFTRHANSDTLSQATGIGAARRWIYGRFQYQAGQPGSDLAPSFFNFNATICALPRLHRNVLAKIPGQVTPARHFIACAHMDSRTRVLCNSTSIAPGANDDGSGVAITVELARVLSGYDFESSLLFLAVTGEEQGLFGSRAYAAWALANGLRIDGMLAIDTVGNITGCVNPACPPGEDIITDSLSVRDFSLGPSTSIHRQLTRAIKLNAERYLPEFRVDLIDAHDRPGRSGDHFAFDERGYAAARFCEPHEFGDGSGNNGHQHNEFDLIDFVHVPYVARMARLNVACLANFALAPETPASPTVVELSGGALLVTWPSVTSAPDVAGYRIALRGTAADSLHYFDIRDAGLDAGPTQQHEVDGLTPEVSLYLSVSAYDSDGNESIFCPEVLATPSVTGVAEEAAPNRSRLLSIDPNPSRAFVRVRLDLEGGGHAQVKVFDASGRLMSVLLDEESRPGAQMTAWDGRDQLGNAAPAGVYLVELLVDSRRLDALKLLKIE